MGGNPLDYLGVQSATTDRAGKVELATDTEATAGTSTTLAMTPANVAAVALSGVSDWSESTKGVGRLSTASQATTGTNDDTAMTPLKVASKFASPGAIGSGTASAGTFTDLTADGTGTVTLTSNAASVYDVTGATNDLTLSSDGGRILLDSGEDAADSIYIRANAGTSETIRLHADQGTGADSIHLESDAGGVTLTAGLATEGAIALAAASGGVNVNSALSLILTGTENAEDAIQLTAANGGINITAGGAAGEDLDLVCTSGSANLSGGEDAADAVVISAGAGGIDITATGEAGQDIDILNTGGSVNVTATEDVASAIYLRANGGTSETIKIHADQGTGVACIDILSDAGGIKLTSNLAAEASINLSAVAGGVSVASALSLIIAGSENAADAVQITSSAGGIDIAASGAAAGEDIDITATGSSVNITSTESAVDAIKIESTLGGIDILASGAAAGEDIDIIATGSSVNITATESVATAIKLDATLGGIDILASGAAAGEDIDIIATGSSVNISSTESAVDAITIDATLGGIDILASGAAAGEDIDIIATGSSVNITSTEAVAAAINLTASTGAGGITLTPGTGDVTIAGTVKKVTAEHVFSSGTDLIITQSPTMITNATTGGIPTGVAGDINLMQLQDGCLMEQFILGTQTIICPRMTSNGLNISLDQTENDGCEINFGARANAKHAYVSQTAAAFFMKGTIQVANVDGVEPLMFGFRKVQANAAAYTSYTDVFALGLNKATGDTKIVIFDNLNNGGFTITDTTDTVANATDVIFEILVSAAGVITATIDSSAPSVTKAMTFDTGDVIMPFFHFLHADTVVGGAIDWSTFECGFQA